MKPRTKLQKQIDEIRKKLPKITQEQKVYAYKHCLDHEATRLKNGTVTCLDCGHKRKDSHYLATTLDCTCPNCNTKLKVKNTRKQKFTDWAYYGIVTSFQGFQIFRYCKVHGIYKAGKPVFHNFYEVAQIWLCPDGKFEIVGYISIKVDGMLKAGAENLNLEIIRISVIMIYLLIEYIQKNQLSRK